ncbi:type II toxin-antitoxin system PemK/MazF family toxin [Lactobacillus crispatus]|nr:type II toxin-antitoxin system PemK/MazF family toxin [Lactobacillus crispatus]MDX5121345.1 type II toxin-antitoxin system PemK/MazF family toxin [Lactobacillus crispatus]
MSKNIATVYVRFVQISGGKRRPIFILQENEDKFFFFDITTKFKNKSEKIKKHYFEIKEYETTGLKKHSWIDTYRRYSVSKKDTNVNYIGRLSDQDTHRLVKFLRKTAKKKFYVKTAIFKVIVFRAGCFLKLSNLLCK